MTEPLSAEETAARLRRALTDHTQGRLAEAEAGYREILAQHPDQPDALGLLALILADGPDAAEGEAVLLRHLALRPRNAASLQALGRLRARQGDEAAAAEAFARAAEDRPDLAPIHNDLGVSLHKLGRRGEALEALERAIALDPAYPAPVGNRGMVLLDEGRFGEAVDAIMTALAADHPSIEDVRVSLISSLVRAAARAGRLAEAEAAVRANIAAGHADNPTVEQFARLLDRMGRAPDALALRNGMARRAGIQRRGPARAARDTLVILGAVGAGHTPTRYLVDPESFSTLSVSLLTPDQADGPLGAVDPAELAGAGAVFSTLADVDRDWGQLAAAEAFCADLGKPVINPPRGIWKTGRDGAQALFAGVPGLVVPPVTPLSPVELADFPFETPILVRPAGDHGGESLVRLDRETDREAYLAQGTAERLLAVPFHDFRSPDGYWRKYRLIFVDRQVYPFHLAIGEDWLLHYWRAEMARSPWKLAEEERFLDDWRGVFGPVAAAAADEAARRLDLDYGGMDCAVTAEGQLLLFEANACILLHLDEPAAVAPAKHRQVPPIREAFTRLVRARADGRGAA